jgi:hypothetical protein
MVHRKGTEDAKRRCFSFLLRGQKGKKPSFCNPLEGLPCLSFRLYAFELIHGRKNRQDVRFCEYFLLFALLALWNAKLIPLGSAKSKKLGNLSALSVSAVSGWEK